jgi:hypothetical protein
LVDFHSHLQALVTDGGFGPMRWFVAFPKMDLCSPEHLFRHRALCPIRDLAPSSPDRALLFAFAAARKRGLHFLLLANSRSA